eukprot:IDg11944t1
MSYNRVLWHTQRIVNALSWWAHHNRLVKSQEHHLPSARARMVYSSVCYGSNRRKVQHILLETDEQETPDERGAERAQHIIPKQPKLRRSPRTTLPLSDTEVPHC